VWYVMLQLIDRKCLCSSMFFCTTKSISFRTLRGPVVVEATLLHCERRPLHLPPAILY
jgi:hypothetical protein